MSFFFYDTGHSAWSAEEWPCGAFRRHGGVDKHEKTYLRGRRIGGKPKWEKAEFAVLSRLKRFSGTKRFRKYIWYELKRLFGTKLCGQHQSGPENGVNNRPFCHRFFNMKKTV